MSTQETYIMNLLNIIFPKVLSNLIINYILFAGVVKERIRLFSCATLIKTLQNGQCVYINKYGVIQFFNNLDNKNLPGTSNVRSIESLPNNNLVTLDTHGKITIWKNYKHLVILNPFLCRYDPDILAILPDSDIAVVHNYYIHIWREHKCSCIYYYVQHNNKKMYHSGITCLIANNNDSYSDTLDNNYLYSGSDDSSIKVWKNYKLLKTLKGHKLGITCMKLLPNSNLVSGSLDNTVKIWRNYKIINSLDCLNPVRLLALFSNNDIAVATHRCILVWQDNKLKKNIIIGDINDCLEVYQDEIIYEGFHELVILH